MCSVIHILYVLKGDFYGRYKPLDEQTNHLIFFFSNNLQILINSYLLILFHFQSYVSLNIHTNASSYFVIFLIYMYFESGSTPNNEIRIHCCMPLSRSLIRFHVKIVLKLIHFHLI